MSLKTVGLTAALFVVAPSAGSAVALLREATLVSAMLAGAAALFMVIGVGLLAGARGSRLVAMGVGVAGVLVVQASHVARLLHRGPADLRVPLSLVEIGLEVVLATCIAVLYADERRVVTRVPPLVPGRSGPPLLPLDELPQPRPKRRLGRHRRASSKSRWASRLHPGRQ